jgi:hypothetical protein
MPPSPTSLLHPAQLFTHLHQLVMLTGEGYPGRTFMPHIPTSLAAPAQSSLISSFSLVMPSPVRGIQDEPATHPHPAIAPAQFYSSSSACNAHRVGYPGRTFGATIPTSLSCTTQSSLIFFSLVMLTGESNSPGRTLCHTSLPSLLHPAHHSFSLVAHR